MKTLSQINLSGILPASLTDDEQMNAVAKSLDAILKKISGEARLILLYSRLDELTSEILDVLAYQLHCDFYDAVNFSLEEKRAAIRKSVEVHRVKGTFYATEQVATEFLDQAQVIELGSFRFGLKCKNYIGLPNALPAHLKRLYDAKNVRSWLDFIEIDLSEPANDINLTAGIAQVVSGLMQFPLPKPEPEAIDLTVGAVSLVTGSLDLALDRSPPDASIDIFIGILHIVEGEIFLGCEFLLPPIKECPIADLAIADIAIARGGNDFLWDDLSFDYLKLYFKFPIHRAPRPRSILISDPRPDITPDQIRALSDYVAANQIILNGDGEISTGINRYALRTKSSRSINII